MAVAAVFAWGIARVGAEEVAEGGKIAEAEAGSNIGDTEVALLEALHGMTDAYYGDMLDRAGEPGRAECAR